VTISTHVLDARTGRPAAGVSVLIERRSTDGWRGIGTGETDADGRLRLTGAFTPGVYRIGFGTGRYFAEQGVISFYPEVTITFSVTSAEEHYHVPLLLSPFAYSTYRGS
jgi:5-hydroxyisourate hydrolase